MTTEQLPKSEYPRPQFVRERWANLNGMWEFEIDGEDDGLARGLDREFNRSILVPFCPESELSGIGDTDFLDVVWYRRELQVPVEWDGDRVLVHFGAVDHDATVWVNGVEVGRHRGGFSPFCLDITDQLHNRAATIVVRARDSRTEPQARGKQATWRNNTGCHYTRTTGIWQTVWMEPVSPSHLARPVIRPDVPGSRFRITVPIIRPRAGQTVRVTLQDDGRDVAMAERMVESAMAPDVDVEIPAEYRRLWSPEDPHLYDLRFELLNDQADVLDSVRAYAGLRSIRIEDHRFLINEEPVFQRLVLDQGYYPDGIMTAASDDALIKDIELSLAAGFNGARLHEKVFEERFLYHADRLGYLVWAEFGDWGAHVGGAGPDCQQPTPSFVTQWLEVLERDQSHPSIIGWCGLNETFAELADHITQLDDVTKAMFLTAKLVDGTRPVLDASGYAHRVPDTDVYDSHSYEQDPEKFAEQMRGLADGEPYVNSGPNGEQWSLPYAGQPYFCSEFGGILWADAQTEDGGDRSTPWGYGDAVRTVEELYERLEGLCQVLISNELMFGYCYTQLTDVFQEQNGIYTFDRSTKFDMARVRQIFAAPAAYEDSTPTGR